MSYSSFDLKVPQWKLKWSLFYFYVPYDTLKYRTLQKTHCKKNSAINDIISVLSQRAYVIRTAIWASTFMGNKVSFSNSQAEISRDANSSLATVYEQARGLY